MGSNQFGNLFKIVTWGESHGKAVGVVIDGCPAGLELSAGDINSELALRRPGNSPYTSPRKEEDLAEIYSGVFEGKTTGAPIAIIIHNRDARSESYVPLKEIFRPGHANFTYLKKYGIFDWRGGGRASARETVTRVAAGAVAKKLLSHFDIDLAASIQAVGECASPTTHFHPKKIRGERDALFCVDKESSTKMQAVLEEVIEQKDSVGGVVELITSPLPAGLGEPVFDKLEATLAHAMLSIPASKGVEFGVGMGAAQMRGSEHNDAFDCDEEGECYLKTNHSGGTLGGISTGGPLVLRVAFKPTSSIGKSQESVSLNGEKVSFSLPEGARHDPCVAIRAVPVVEAMAALALADHLLINRTRKL